MKNDKYYLVVTYSDSLNKLKKSEHPFYESSKRFSASHRSQVIAKMPKDNMNFDPLKPLPRNIFPCTKEGMEDARNYCQRILEHQKDFILNTYAPKSKISQAGSFLGDVLGKKGSQLSEDLYIERRIKEAIRFETERIDTEAEAKKVEFITNPLSKENQSSFSQIKNVFEKKNFGLQVKDQKALEVNSLTVETCKLKNNLGTYFTIKKNNGVYEIKENIGSYEEVLNINKENYLENERSLNIPFKNIKEATNKIFEFRNKEIRDLQQEIDRMKENRGPLRQFRKKDEEYEQKIRILEIEAHYQKKDNSNFLKNGPEYIMNRTATLEKLSEKLKIIPEIKNNIVYLVKNNKVQELIPEIIGVSSDNDSKSFIYKLESKDGKNVNYAKQDKSGKLITLNENNNEDINSIYTNKKEAISKISNNKKDTNLSLKM